MSRVSDAMRRAGYGGGESSGGSSGDAPFVAGESNLSEDQVDVAPGEQPVTNPAPERHQSDVKLVHRPRPLPVPITRDASVDDVSIVEVIRVAHRRRWLILPVIVAFVGGAFLYNVTATRIYEARARLLIDPESPHVVPFRPVTEDTTTFDYYLTQIEILRSRDLARRTLQRLNLLSGDDRQAAAQIDQLLSSLTVAPVKTDQVQSRVLNLTVRSEDPGHAARIANGLAETYVDQNLDTRRRGTREASRWLNERLIELRQKVTDSARALQQYREDKDSVSLEDGQDIVVQKLAQLNAVVTTARTERLEKEALYRQLTAIQESGEAVDTFPAILSNSFIQTLKADLAALQRQRVQLAERLGDLHPDMIKVDSEIETAERRLNTETAKVVEGIRNEFRAAEARERGLVAALEAQKREVLDLNQKSIAYGALQRDAASTQQIFESVLQRVKETELSGELQANNARILDAAEVPNVPIWPRTQLNLLLAFIVGSFLAFGVAVGVEYLNPRITKPADIGDALGLPVLGIAPHIAALTKRGFDVTTLPQDFQEALRGVRTTILLSPTAANARALAVTSTNAGEGKTVIASSLAVSMAMAGRRVLLVDADMRRSQLHRLFDISQSPGLSNILAGGATPNEAVVESRVEGLFVLPAGDGVLNPSDLLDTATVTNLIQAFSRVFDIVVLDCPPVMAVADASIIANSVSSALFVVGAGATSREFAQVAIDRLTSVQVDVIGVVLNKAKSDHGRGYYASPYVVTTTAPKNA